MSNSNDLIYESNYIVCYASGSATWPMYCLDVKDPSTSSTVLIKQYEDKNIFEESNFIKNPEIKSEITKINSFKKLPENWNGYKADPISNKAIQNSIDFLLRLDRKQKVPSFIAPIPNGGVGIELERGNFLLEFIFLSNGSSEIAGYIENEKSFDHKLDETTEKCALKWLYCPYGNCDWE